MLLSLKVNILTSFNSRTPGGVRRRKVINILTLNSFNSRTPGGVRRRREAQFWTDMEFQFTHPGRGATKGLSS